MRAVLVLAAVLAVGMPQLQAADDAKFFSGSACHPVFGTDTSTYEYYGILYNTSNASLWVSCDLVRDTTTVEIAWVSVLDNSPVADVFCAFVVKNHTGTWTSYSTGASSGTGRQAFWVGTPGDAYYGTYAMQCLIPGSYNGLRSGIEIIGVMENE